MLVALLVPLWVGLAESQAVPFVPYHRQVNDYTCGAAAAEMVLNTYGGDVDQRQLVNVMCTSPQVGTFSEEITRAGHFSNISSATCNQTFPAEWPGHGWDFTSGPARTYGYASFWRRVQGQAPSNCWVKELKDAVREGFPIVVLMWFTEEDKEGHFRVVYGVTDSTVLLLDPWDRPDLSRPNKMQPRYLELTDAEFCGLWLHNEKQANLTMGAFFAAVVVPWTVDLSAATAASSDAVSSTTTTTTITAKITYPCPVQFCNTTAVPETLFGPQPTAQAAVAELSVVGGSAKVLSDHRQQIGTLHPGQSTLVEWTVLGDSGQSEFRVQAVGLIRGHMGAAYVAEPGREWIPAYDYSDWIGGEATLA
eukprot:m.106252 g.106252  ORF g.106252 m.106252 type:complete len:364 (-) comp18983_c0_seq3:52-1143(-)